ncbi:MAG TPA: hypothetical protein VFQ43_19060, partial [Nitrososphaera sp.]|nr:hypothetical protein [Nitrososphaera sp.]
MTKLRLSFKDALNPVFLRKIASLIFMIAAGIFLLRLVVFVIHEPFLEGDSRILVADHIGAIRKCLSAGRFWQCPDSGVWPLFQHVPTLVLSYLGLSTSLILHVLAYISFLSFLGSVVLVYWTLQKKASRAAA